MASVTKKKFIKDIQKALSNQNFCVVRITNFIFRMVYGEYQNMHDLGYNIYSDILPTGIQFFINPRKFFYSLVPTFEVQEKITKNYFLNQRAKIVKLINEQFGNDYFICTLDSYYEDLHILIKKESVKNEKLRVTMSETPGNPMKSGILDISDNNNQHCWVIIHKIPEFYQDKKLLFVRMASCEAFSKKSLCDLFFGENNISKDDFNLIEKLMTNPENISNDEKLILLLKYPEFVKN